MSEVSWLLVTAAVALALRTRVAPRWRDRAVIVTFALAACAHVVLVDRISDDDLSDALHLAEIRTDGVSALQVEAEHALGADLDLSIVTERRGTTLVQVRRIVWGLTTASACIGTRSRTDHTGVYAFVLPRAECDTASAGSAAGRPG